MRGPGLLWLLPALPAAALTPGTTVSPPKATQNWWDAFFAPAPQPLLVRDDGTRLRRGTREDAPRIRQLWAANVAPNSLGEAWSPGGIETAFVYRKTRDGRAAATSVVAYDEDRRLAGFAAATAADEPFNNLGPLVEWKTFSISRTAGTGACWGRSASRRRCGARASSATSTTRCS